MGTLSIEHSAPTVVEATIARGVISLEHAASAGVSLDAITGDVSISSALPAAVSIATTSTTVSIATHPSATITIDASSTPAVSLAQHDALDSLAHEIAETSETEYAYDGDGNVTRVTVWTSSAHTIKVREKTLAYTSGVLSASTTTQHDAAGAVIATLTKTFTYDGDGNLVASITTRS